MCALKKASRTIEPLWMIDYQDFLYRCQQIHHRNIQHYRCMQVSLRLLGHSQRSKTDVTRRLMKNLDAALEKVLWVNQWTEAFFKELHENTLDCRWNAIEIWFCDLSIEHQRNVIAFLQQHYDKIDRLIGQLPIHDPHEPIGFYFSRHLARMMHSLQSTYLQQKSIISHFEQHLKQCSLLRQSSGSQQLSILLQYCRISAKIAQKFKGSSQYKCS